MNRKVWLVMLVLVFAGGAGAQEICPALVRAAFETAAESCTTLARNQVCYGNVLLEVEAQPDAPPMTFEQAGDIADLGHIARLSLSSMDTAAETWGMALLRTQANLPDTLPGQNVTMILFGEVEMTDAAPEAPEPEPEPVLLDVSAGGNINVRGGPSTNAAIVAALSANVTVTADGRNADGSWLRVLLADGGLGWVFAQLVTVDGDASTLPVIDPNAPVVVEEVPELPTYTPMQAFYFTSAIGDSPCAEAPDSGILIQTPQGAGTINLLVNGVEINLGSTSYIQAQPGGEMVVNIVEGRGIVSAFERRVTIPAGARARIPLDGDGQASGEPVGPEPYDEAAFSALPLVLLPDEVTIAPALVPGTGDRLARGEWTAVADVATDPDCDRDGQQFFATYTILVSYDPASDSIFNVLSPSQSDSRLEFDARLAVTAILEYLFYLERNPEQELPRGEIFTLLELTIESPEAVSAVAEMQCSMVTISMRFTGDNSQGSAAPGRLQQGEWVMTTTECPTDIGVIPGFTAPVEYLMTPAGWGGWVYDHTLSYTETSINHASVFASQITLQLGCVDI